MAARPEGPLAFSLPLLEKDNAAAWRLLCHFLYLPGHGAETGHVAAQGLNCTSCLSPEEVARAFGSTQGVMRSRPAGPSPAPGCLGTHTAGAGRGPLGRRPRDGAGQGHPPAALTGGVPRCQLPEHAQGHLLQRPAAAGGSIVKVLAAGWMDRDTCVPAGSFTGAGDADLS